MTVLGSDFSHWQTSTPSLAGLGFVIVKASEGTTADPMYLTHMAKVRSSGKLPGAYCFSRNDVSLDAQAKFFVNHAQGAAFLAVDNEARYATPQDRTAYLINRIRWHDPLGRLVGLYMSESGFQSAGQDFDWVANWIRTPHHPYLIWQYRGSPLDLDRYEGTLAQLKDALAPIPDAPPSDIGGSVNSYNIIHDVLARVDAGAYLHVDSDMVADAANVKVPAGGWELPLSGNDTAGKFRIVEYKGKAWWIYWDAVGSMRPTPEPVDPTPFDQQDLDESAATSAKDEKERIAKAVGEAEAARIRTL
jgi:hypothetical protein